MIAFPALRLGYAKASKPGPSTAGTTFKEFLLVGIRFHEYRELAEPYRHSLTTSVCIGMKTNSKRLFLQKFDFMEFFLLHQITFQD